MSYSGLMSQLKEDATIAELHLMWPADRIDGRNLGPKMYRAKEDAPPLINHEPTLADIKVGEVFKLDGVLYRKLEGGVRKARGRAPSTLMQMDPNTKVGRP
jgi:hypothetical protein